MNMLKKIVNSSVLKRKLRRAMMSLPHIKRRRKKYLAYIKSCYSYPEKTPTLLCSTCIGGMIFHNLGLKFMSPTINLWMTASDFVKFVCGLDRYLSAELEFFKSEYDYPVAKLDDITVYFTHYHTEEDARSKWNERKARIDRDNLYIITDDNGLTDDEIKSLQSVECRRTLIFTTEENRGEGFFRFCGCKEKHPAYSVRGLDGFALFEREFNYAKWLSGEKDIRI